jgi:maltokinase
VTHPSSAASDLAGLVARWLPGQRWFAGAGARISELAIASDVVLAPGDPQFRHLLVDVSIAGDAVRYQLPLGFRAQLPAALSDAEIGRAADGMIAYDGMRDPELTSLLLKRIAGQAGQGPIRFVAADPEQIDANAPGRTLPAEQSNTSVVFGEKAILKIFRRPVPGRHPDLELTRELARGRSGLVAAPLGWIELETETSAGAGADAGTTVLAILSEFYPRAVSGWTLATSSVAGGTGFAADARALGETTGQLHSELAAAFGTSTLDRPALRAMAAGMNAVLDKALAVVPALAAHEAELRAYYAELAGYQGTVPVQRIHGDFHLAQVLRTPTGWIVLDFEGEPSVPLAMRQAAAPALRDVAGMLRSIDYAGRFPFLGQPADGQHQAQSLAWISQCQQAFCDGYSTAGPDPGDSEPLLRALIAQKAVYEAVYEALHRPDWLSIPLSAIADLS